MSTPVVTSKRRGRDPTKTQSAIMSSARKLFTELGFHGVSVKDIAKHACVNQSLIHHHYTSKLGLWRAVKNQLFEEYDASFHQNDLQDSTDLKQSLRNVIEWRFNYLRKNPEFQRMMLWDCAEDISQQVDDSRQNILHDLNADILRAQQQGVINSTVSPAFILVTILTITMAWFPTNTQWLLQQGNDKMSSEAFINNLETIITDGVFTK